MKKMREWGKKRREAIDGIMNKPSENKKHNTLFRVLSGAPTVLCALYCLYVFATLLTLVLIDKKFSCYFRPNRLTILNKVLIVPVLLLFVLTVCVFFFLQRKNRAAKQKLSEKQFYVAIGMAFMVVYGLQLFISAHISFLTGWDVGIITEAARSISLGEADGVPLEYYSTYPNNMLLTYTLVMLYRIGDWLIPSHPYAVILAFLSLVVCASVFLATMCIYRITGNRKFTVFGMLLGTLLIAISPWIVIPYTDAMAMIFPVAAIFWYLYIKNKYARYALITFTCILGTYYKPTVIIVWIALVIIKAFAVPEALCRKRLSLKSCACLALCIVLAAGCATSVNRAASSQNKTALAETMPMTMTHYFMMGLNTQMDGVYCAEDVVYSMRQPDVASRQRANIEVAKNRLKEMGPKGYLKLLITKNILNYNDGTFGWGREGSFYRWIPETDSRIAKVLRSFYYTNEQGTNILVFATAEQIVWLFMLICICFCALPMKIKNNAESLISLSLLGVSIFLLLFECRARYFFLFTPLFVILAVVGLYKITLSLMRREGTASIS